MNAYKPLVWSGTAVLVILSLFLLVSIDQKMDTAPSTYTVSFSGEGKVFAKPDVATVDLSILTEAPTSKDAQDQNNKKSKSLTDFLKGKEIDEKDIKTISYNIYPQYNYPQFSAPRITGYQVNQTVQVKVRKLDSVNEILDGVVASGVNQVNSLQFSVDDPEKLRSEAREMAIKDAKEKAEVLEDQLDINIGKIVSFNEDMGGYPGPIYYDKLMSAEGIGGGNAAPSIPTGENEIRVNVTLTYQVK